MTGFVTHPSFAKHETGPGHPERPARLEAVLEAVKGLPLEKLEARAATEKDVKLCHGADYVALAKRDILEGMPTLETGDTSICEASWDAALYAAGSVLAAIDALFAGTIQNAFCAVRPPGHHATANRGMGFCIFNNVAIGARYAQRMHGIERVLIVDWDVHHGNGTQDIFYRDPGVFFFSTHQWPLYPGTGTASETGEGPGLGTTLNCPVPAGSGRSEIFQAFEGQLLPAMEKFRPELVLISAGFDSRRGDPLGSLLLEDADFADLTRLVRGICSRVISVLEGGYSRSGLAAATRAHVQALCHAL